MRIIYIADELPHVRREQGISALNTKFPTCSRRNDVAPASFQKTCFKCSVDHLGSQGGAEYRKVCICDPYEHRQGCIEFPDLHKQSGFQIGQGNVEALQLRGFQRCRDVGLDFFDEPPHIGTCSQTFGQELISQDSERRSFVRGDRVAFLREHTLGDLAQHAVVRGAELELQQRSHQPRIFVVALELQQIVGRRRVAIDTFPIGQGVR